MPKINIKTNGKLEQLLKTTGCSLEELLQSFTDDLSDTSMRDESVIAKQYYLRCDEITEINEYSWQNKISKIIQICPGYERQIKRD